MILITPGAFRHVSEHHQISHFHLVLMKIQVLATVQLSSCTPCKPVQCYGLRGSITLSRSVWAGLAIKNHVAFVQESKSLINLVCSLLIGAPPEHVFARSAGKSSCKTKYFQETKGVIGHALGYTGVVEDHAKGTLHYHLLIMGGLTPHLLQWFISTREVCQKITKVLLDSIYLSEVPFPDHVAQAVRRVLRGKVTMDITDQELLKGDEALLNHTNMMALCHDQQIDTGLLHKTITNQVSQQQTHSHMETCKKGVLCRTGCHLSMPFGSLFTTSCCTETNQHRW